MGVENKQYVVTGFTHSLEYCVAALSSCSMVFCRFVSNNSHLKQNTNFSLSSAIRRNNCCMSCQISVHYTKLILLFASRSAIKVNSPIITEAKANTC